jgi:glycine oxidase
LASVDVSIRGAGIFGLCCAWFCLEAGARVEIVDPSGVASGASGGVVGALAPHVPENWNSKKQFQLESLLMARSFWPMIEELTGLSTGYAPLGRVQPVMGKPGLDLAEQRAASARALWGSHAIWQLQRDASGWQLESPTGYYIKDTLSAHIHPRAACTALAKALKARGCTFSGKPNSPAGATIWATGTAGLEALSQGHTRAMGQGIKGQAALLGLDRLGLPQLFAQSLHVIPHKDGTVAVGSTTERDFTSATSTDEQLEALLDHARQVVPELKNAPVLTKWAGLRPRARSRAPILGAWPGKPGHFIANGGFKIGYGMAPKVGEVMADLVLKGVQSYPDAFDVKANEPH